MAWLKNSFSTKRKHTESLCTLCKDEKKAMLNTLVDKDSIETGNNWKHSWKVNSVANNLAEWKKESNQSENNQSV